MPASPSPPPPWKSDNVVNILLTLKDADYGIIASEAKQLSDLKRDVCGAARAATQSIGCAVTSIQPGSVVMSLSLLAASATSLGALREKAAKLCADPRPYFIPFFTTTYGARESPVWASPSSRQMPDLTYAPSFGRPSPGARGQAGGLTPRVSTDLAPRRSDVTPRGADLANTSQYSSGGHVGGGDDEASRKNNFGFDEDGAGPPRPKASLDAPDRRDMTAGLVGRRHGLRERVGKGNTEDECPYIYKAGSNNVHQRRGISGQGSTERCNESEGQRSRALKVQIEHKWLPPKVLTGATKGPYEGIGKRRVGKWRRGVLAKNGI
eukprot:gene28337-31458_t